MINYKQNQNRTTIKIQLLCCMRAATGFNLGVPVLAGSASPGKSGKLIKVMKGKDFLYTSPLFLSLSTILISY